MIFVKLFFIFYFIGMVYPFLNNVQKITALAIIKNHKKITRSMLLSLSSSSDSILIEEIPQSRKMIKIKFINTPDGKNVSVMAEEGQNLLFVGDNAGVKLPRACRTGLCGSCTCDLQDPAAIQTSTNPRDGYATIRFDFLCILLTKKRFSNLSSNILLELVPLIAFYQRCDCF
jgi:ferredoxin